MQETESPEVGRQTTMLDVIIDRLRGYGTPAHRVWLPPLAEAPSLDSLLGELTVDEKRGLVAPAWRRRTPAHRAGRHRGPTIRATP